jgi:hypothetical protein
LALELWQAQRLDEFCAKRLLPSRKGTRWDQVLFVLVAYRLLAPGSEWRLHREWVDRSTLADLLGADAGLSDIHTLYRCHDRLLEHKRAVFDHLTDRWRDLFNASFDVLLYDLTSTYFECDPPRAEGAKRRFGYSRDRRPDCVQVVIALVVTPEGLPLAYEVLADNTACLHVTPSRRLHPLAPGLTPRSVIEKFTAVQMFDVHTPTTDARKLVLTRYTQPEPELTLLLDKLAIELPAQPPPTNTASQLSTTAL